MEWYHQKVGIVQQEPVLFSGTISENILYGLDIDEKTDE
jgi:ABC-type multidrug transport system fused ATPase/permease subunit